MKALIYCLFSGVLAAQIQPRKTQDLCSLEGRVLNEATGEPLKDATLALRPVQPAAASQAVFTTMSDDSGRFAFAGVEPGRYTLGAKRMGFVAGTYGAKRPGTPGTPLPLAQNITGVEFKLKPQGVIAGRVLDADDDPVQFAFVNLMRAKYVNGRKQLSAIGAREMGNASGGSEVTNDQGQFRFFGLAPGRYYVRASTGGTELERVSKDRSAKPAQEEYVETFHPSTVDARRAEPVEVLAGKVASGRDVILARVPLARIRGRVVNLAEVAAAGGVPAVSIYRADGTLVGGARLGTQGEFDINSRAPQGRGWLLARLLTANNAVVHFSRQPLSLSGGPMEGVEISLNAGIPLRGNVRLEDGGAVRVDLRSIKISVTLPDLEIGGPMPQASVGSDGSFTGANIGPDRYLLTVSGMPSGVYVKSIRMGEKDALEDGLDLTRGSPAPLEIVLSGKSGAVEGLVKDAKDQPESGVTVALVPQSAKRRERPDWYRTAITDQQGRFAMAGLPPGEYMLFAWGDVEDGAWMDPEFLKPVEASGSAVTVREGGSETVELKIIGVP